WPHPAAPPLGVIGHPRTPDRDCDDRDQQRQQTARRDNLHLIVCHTADAILLTKNRPAPKVEVQKPSIAPGAGCVRNAASRSRTTAFFFCRLSSNRPFANS